VAFTNITEIKLLVGAYSSLDLIGLIPLDARPKAWVCGRSLTDITSVIPVGGTNVPLVSVVVRYVSLRRADPSSRGVLPNICH
jgi:hypothetical protein